MEITETLHIFNREEWTEWLKKNHLSAKEIWLIYYRKQSGKPRISYNDAVEVALCYGWIDSTLKVIDEERTAQRYSPRRKNSILSQLNKERIRKLISSGEMTTAGLDAIGHHLDEQNLTTGKKDFKKFIFPEDIMEKLRVDPVVWQNFQNFPEQYKVIRIGWISEVRHRQAEFEKRLAYFMKMTKKNKMYGMAIQYLGDKD